MKNWILKLILTLLACILLASLAVIFLARKDIPEKIQYGMSFNTPYVLELGLDSEEVFDAFINDLGVRDFRLSAHWTLIEPLKDVYEYSWLDYQIEAVEAIEGSIIFGVGRRLPRWPECHVPAWAAGLTWEEQKEEIREYIARVVMRYKNSPAITYWQIENEPYLTVFAKEHCGEFDEAFLEEEIQLVRSLDPSRPILVTDSGNLGTWRGAYRHGDAFGTSVYVYFWNPELGQFKTILPAWYYRVKESLVQLVYGKKETFLIELAAEPWLLESVSEVPIDVQFSRMDPEKFDEIIEYAKNTRYESQYLWGGEWWYWLKERGYNEMWEKGKVLFTE